MIDQLISKYIVIRDRKAALKKKYDADVAALDEALDKIEKALAGHLDKTGLQRVGAGEGIAFFQQVRSATVADKPAFLQFLQDTEQWHLADIRAAKAQISEYRDEKDDLPPGINWSEARVVRVNRA